MSGPLDPSPNHRHDRPRPVAALIIAALAGLAGVLALVVVLGGPQDTQSPPTPSAVPGLDAPVDGSIETSAGTSIAEYPDAMTRHLQRLAAEPRPVPRSALPPRQLNEEIFPESLVPRDRIVSGGPPPDGIPSIDAPLFVEVGEVDWIGTHEPVLVLDVDGLVRVYPLQILIWHEIVNDVLGDRAVAVTYCPLCNSGVAFDRMVDDQLLVFGTSGALYQSAMVMYDRQTESLWTHFDGRAVVGDLVGAELEMLPLAMVAWSDVVEAHPGAEVLSTDTGFARNYGLSPYGVYGSGEQPLAGFFTGEVDERLRPMERVIGIDDGRQALAIPIARVAEHGVVAFDHGDPRTAWHLPGATWAIGSATIGESEAIGATAVFDPRLDGELLEFERVGDWFVDRTTGSRWSIFGIAVGGPLEGSRLEPVVHLDTFWFAWSTYRSQTDVMR